SEAWFECMDEVTSKRIGKYIEVRGREHGYLFHGRTLDKPLNVRAVNSIIHALAERVGVAVTPHGLRHTAATTLLKRTNGNVRATQEFLRHKSATEVLRYDDERVGLAKQMNSVLSDRKARK